MTDQPVTPDREARRDIRDDRDWMVQLAMEALDRLWTGDDDSYPTDRREAEVAVDALLPLIADAVDQARQQGKREGRDEAAEAIEAEAEKDDPGFGASPDYWTGLDVAARLARGADDRKAADDE